MRPPGFPGNPPARMPRAPTPARSPPPRPLRCGEIAFRPTHDVGPHKQCISGLNHAAYGLPVNASRPGSPQAHASLGSGWWPTLAGWGWIPTGFRTRFRRSHHGILSSLTGLSRHTRWCTAPQPRSGRRSSIRWSCCRLAAHDLAMKSRVHPKYKTKYRVGNWRAYERALVQRGDVTLWLSADARNSWRPSPFGQPGGQRRFSDLAITTALTLRLVFRLPLRQAEGFLRSVLSLMDVDLEAPDHTTLSRRSRALDIELHRVPVKGPIHLIVDSTWPFDCGRR